MHVVLGKGLQQPSKRLIDGIYYKICNKFWNGY